MIYLSGAMKPEIKGIGFMLTPNSDIYATLPAGRIWAADSGRFANPAAYSDDKFLAWLSERDPSMCLFATAPDIVGDHKSTIKLSMPMLPRIRSLGYKVAFVAQDGWDGNAPWDEFDCIFIGGTTTFKLGDAVPGIISEARRRGKWTHMGRVNSYKRLRVAKAIGCQSADGTFLKFGPDKNSVRLLRWLDRLDEQHLMEMHP